MIEYWLLLIGLLILPACAVHYYDEKTGAEHIFGLGHMVMKASTPDKNHQAIVRGTDILGVAFGKNDEGSYLSLGWDSRRRINVINEDALIELVWPDGDFLNTRIGSSLPSKTLKKTEIKE
jgi:hypothetical protein